MLKFHALEMATDTSYMLWVDISEENFNHVAAVLLARYAQELESYALGTVYAATIDEALNRIRSGKWEFTQKC